MDVEEEDLDEDNEEEWYFPQPKAKSKHWKSRIGVYGCQHMILSVETEAQLN